MSSHQERLIGLYKAITADDMLGGFIRVHLYIEYELNLFIEARLPPGVIETLKPDYDRKISLAIALGLLPDLKSPLRKIGEYRNRFAHNLDHKLLLSDVDGLFKSFSPAMKEITQRWFARVRKLPSGADYPSTHLEMNGASRLQFYVMQIWMFLAHANDPSFEPAETLPHYMAE
ncbi:hypothetical protein [Microvirga sp. BSC39]|uniref:hypothetical protein n=1 Tax=Microvirga sp. BSC39 TaxID=1549810 RepID=UPI0004E8E0D5|nr:hypothetical protein [Microvirga sp. BSC39]KFG68727.1 hypothetical protein JH26_14770 [Microvirga sp. BSC39]